MKKYEIKSKPKLVKSFFCWGWRSEPACAAAVVDRGEDLYLCESLPHARCCRNTTQAMQRRFAVQVAVAVHQDRELLPSRQVRAIYDIRNPNPGQVETWRRKLDDGCVEVFRLIEEEHPIMRKELRCPALPSTKVTGSAKALREVNELYLQQIENPGLVASGLVRLALQAASLCTSLAFLPIGVIGALLATH